MTKKVNDDAYLKHSPGKLYEFNPDESITWVQVMELTNIIRIGIGGHVLKEMSEDLQKHFKEVA